MCGDAGCQIPVATTSVLYVRYVHIHYVENFYSLLIGNQYTRLYSRSVNVRVCSTQKTKLQ